MVLRDLTYLCLTEPFNDDGTWRSDIFYNTLNTSYVPIALRAARRADPKAKLYINDYNIEGTGSSALPIIPLCHDHSHRYYYAQAQSPQP